jgi:hypothetical protein
VNGIQRALFLLLRKRRHHICANLLDPNAKSLLDLGGGDGAFAALARQRGYDAAWTDRDNDITTATGKADIITCFEVLEHVRDPIRAMENVSRLYTKQLIITGPNEPLFSMLRLGWDPEHMWAITPQALRTHLGPPAFESTIVLNRYYLGVWKRP